MRVKKFKWKKWMWEVLLLNVVMIVIITVLFLVFLGKIGVILAALVVLALLGIIGANVLWYYCRYKGMVKKEEDKANGQEEKNQKKQQKALDRKIEVCKEFQNKFKELNKYIESKKQEENGNLEITELEKIKDEILRLLVQLPEINDYERMRNRTEIKRKKVSEIVDRIYYDVLECTDKTKSLEYCYCIMRNCYSDIILAAGTWQLFWEKEKAEL